MSHQKPGFKKLARDLKEGLTTHYTKPRGTPALDLVKFAWGFSAGFVVNLVRKPKARR